MTHAERLSRILQQFPPVQEQTTKGGAPYRITTTDTGVHIRITNADGDSLGASGATMDDALTALEKKVSANA